jgi:glycosyltransferase involved in cell wall biosynthesis
MATILVLGVKVPFTSGGQEALVKSLVTALKERGHEADSVELPFALPTRQSLLQQISLWRGLDFESFAGKKVDLVIATKFPSYFARHPRKSLWLVHQHRPLYDLYGGNYSDFSDDPRDEVLRNAVSEADRAAIAECTVRAGISQNVVDRLETFCHINAACLYPPLPLGNRYQTLATESYILSVGRLCGIKRVDLLLKALPRIHEFVKLKIVGQPDEPGFLEYLQNEASKHHLWHRVEFLGRVDDETLIRLYAQARAVYYAPHNEDYGYVTLEAMASSKPVVTAHDSGGVLEFVRHEENGLVVEPTLDGISAGFNRLVENPEWAERLGQSGREHLDSLSLSEGWDAIVSYLLQPLEKRRKAA